MEPQIKCVRCGLTTCRPIQSPKKVNPHLFGQWMICDNCSAIFLYVPPLKAGDKDYPKDQAEGVSNYEE